MGLGLNKYRPFLENLNAFSLTGVAFLIPFHSVLNRYFLGIFFVSTLLIYVQYPHSFQIKKYKGWIVLFLLFFIYAISILYSQQFKLAWIDLEKKLPLLLLPLALIVVSPGKEQIQKLYRVFLAGVLSVTLICAGFFIYHTFSDPHFHRVLVNHPFYQLYSKFYIFGNTNYYAVYLNTGVCLILGTLTGRPYQLRDKRFKLLWYIALILFVGLSMAISSRSGIVALVILLLFSIYYLVRLRYFSLVSMALLIVAGLYMMRNYRFTTYIELFDKLVHSPQQIKQSDLLENNASRLIFWKASAEIIRENIWFGVGMGDVKSQMQDKYAEMGVYEALHENDDPHNQFLRTFVATGLPGFIALAGIFVIGFFRGIQDRNYFLLAFLILILIHFLFKSMLFRENGVIFFSFFYSLFIHPMPGK